MADGAFYPQIDPYDTGMLAVGGPHQIYWEQSGNPKGVPVVFLHGGPGAGASPAHRRFFDPTHYRIVIFDQRGAGRSKPLGEIQDNNTPQLVADIERLRQHLKIERWHVFGGSWGSTLAIAYAEHIPASERHDLLRAYYKRLTDPNPEIYMPAARRWSIYEARCCTLLPSPETVEAFSTDVVALGIARMEAHYFSHDIFLPENFLLENIGRIRHIPTVVVQGRYDLVCPPDTADDLRRAWPEVEFTMVPDAGHSAMEPGIRAGLVAAMDRFRNIK
jgi:proline iminopeptidase